MSYLASGPNLYNPTRAQEKNFVPHVLPATNKHEGDTSNVPDPYTFTYACTCKYATCVYIYIYTYASIQAPSIRHSELATRPVFYVDFGSAIKKLNSFSQRGKFRKNGKSKK